MANQPASPAPLRTSVALCSWNGGQFIDEQLESLARQIRLPDELIRDRLPIYRRRVDRPGWEADAEGALEDNRIRSRRTRNGSNGTRPRCSLSPHANENHRRSGEPSPRSSGPVGIPHPPPRRDRLRTAEQTLSSLLERIRESAQGSSEENLKPLQCAPSMRGQPDYAQHVSTPTLHSAFVRGRTAPTPSRASLEGD